MTAREKRCENCTECSKRNGKLICNDMWGKECNEIEECSLGFELAEIDSIAEKAAAVKIDHGTGKTAKTERKAKVTKVSDEKKQVFGEIAELLKNKYGENAEIKVENKLIVVHIGEKHIKIDIIDTKKP